MNRIRQILVAWGLPLFLSGCAGPPIIPLYIQVQYDPELLPIVTPSDPKLAGGACLILPTDEAVWVSHSIVDSKSAYYPTEIHVGEITRQVAQRVLASYFAEGATESAENAQNRVKVYVKVDHFRLADVLVDPLGRSKDTFYYSFSWIEYLILKLYVTVRFTTPDGSQCWERAYESKPRIPHDFAPSPKPKPTSNDAVVLLFQATLAEVLQQAVTDYRDSTSSATSLAPAPHGT